MGMKKCSKCQTLKNIEFFNKNKSQKDGLSAYCIPCKRAHDKKYYAKNSSRVKFSVSLYREKHPEKVKECKKKEYQKNRESYLLRSKNNYHSNKEAINSRSKEARRLDKSYSKKAYERTKVRKAQDPGFRAILNVRQRLSVFLKGKPHSYSKKLGCNVEILKKHLESQFQPGMSWENYGEWHVDHKIALSTAWELGPEEFAKSCHYTNLQPLWALDNIRKGNR